STAKSRSTTAPTDAPMPDADPPRDETRCVRPSPEHPSTTRPLVPPLDLSVVYRVAGLDQIDALASGAEVGWTYARDGHPNAARPAAGLAELDGADAGLICASGMAAGAAIALALPGAGTHVALSRGRCGKTLALLGSEMDRFGVS